jgi:chromosomal replication initiation ATPase DnaA
MDLRVPCHDCPYVNREPPRERTSLVEIAREIAQASGVLVSDIVGPARVRPYAWIRQRFFYEAILRTKASLPVIGRWCGHRDHTTVLYGARKHAARHGLPPPMRSRINAG